MFFLTNSQNLTKNAQIFVPHEVG